MEEQGLIHIADPGDINNPQTDRLVTLFIDKNNGRLKIRLDDGTIKTLMVNTNEEVRIALP